MNIRSINRIIVVLFCVVALATSCDNRKGNSIVYITDSNTQDAVFNNLIALTHGALPESVKNDSLAFLILPVQASCPSCRNKTIDSIVANSDKLPDRHFIIISANGGRKTINGFFMENDKELPVIKDRLFLDTINMAFRFDLYDEKPTMYYTFNKKAYRKVAAIPMTVKEDLREFFTGHRYNEN
jgi:hypothetical protein